MTRKAKQEKTLALHACTGCLLATSNSVRKIMRGGSYRAQKTPKSMRVFSYGVLTKLLVVVAVGSKTIEKTNTPLVGRPCV